MSRFSKAAAEKAGWSIFHTQDAVTEIESETQGRSRLAPASIRAEKYFNGSLITEEAESIGLLLERIASFEAHLARIEDTSLPAPAAPEVEEVKVKDGVPVPTGELVSSETGADVDSAALAREADDEKSSDPAEDPEGEAVAQVFPGEVI